jgi:energy-coupling factor transporter ATP-binding protein EcfA2
VQPASFALAGAVFYPCIVAGADFIRADLHVHTFTDGEIDPTPDLAAYVAAATANGIQVLAVTDHNTCRFARPMIKAAEGTGLFVVPGVEISTHDGHVLALFGPEALAELEAFVNPTNLKLTSISETEQRSTRALLDLVDEIDRRGGLAVPAHVDAADGIHEKLKPAELAELLTSPALAGLEFHRRDALETWFTDNDPDAHRLAAWKARQNVAELRDRGLGRLMSSDAHSVDKVGQDRSTRTLTRLRLDDLNFEAVRLAIQLNPKARCKAEAILPATYPRVVKAELRGGFLDGVTLEFSPNLNCVIGGRGSGKSTALLAMRAALGAELAPDDDPDNEERMPSETLIHFIDSTGSERRALRRRGEDPVDADSGSPIRLRLADLGQDESGRLARGYREQPEIILAFLDGFVVKHRYDEQELDLLARLEENSAEVRRTAVRMDQIKSLESDRARLDASLKAAQTGKVEQIAEWAALLAAQAPLLDRLATDLDQATTIPAPPNPIDIDALAAEFGVDLTRRGEQFVEGSGGLRQALAELEQESRTVRATATAALGEAAKAARQALERWQRDQADLEARLRAKQTELEAQGLKVQAGAVRQIATRLQAVNVSLAQLRKKQVEHQKARAERLTLLGKLRDNRDALYQARRATLKRIADAANAYAENLDIRVSFDQSGLNAAWIRWLTARFSFRTPRVQRLAEKISPSEFATALLTDRASLLSLRDDRGDPFFTADVLSDVSKWDDIFLLETMGLDDRPRIEVQERGNPKPKPFDLLSAGQQRSVLLSLLLCAERDEPLILDQPEDHLDAEYIASGVVRHLEAAKERRQVIIATHSPNLTVLGDAELVVPMHVEDGRGRPSDVGSVDRPETRRRVCALLEGGIEAYRKRGERYGFRFASIPD